VAAQKPAAASGDPRPAATPTPETKTETTPEPKPSPELVLEFGGGYESLSNDKPDWQYYFFRFNRKFSSGQVLYGEASIFHRFGATDPYFMVGFVQPLNKSKDWIGTLELAGSPTHDVVYTASFYGRVDRKLGRGWVANAALRHSHYTDDNVDIGIFGAEKYFKAYRAAYNLFVAHLHGKGTSASHVFQGNYYYGERNSVGVGFAFGQEIESVGNGQFIRANVREVNLTGRHWFNKKWGLSYLALWHREGTFYDRSGAYLGLLLRF